MKNVMGQLHLPPALPGEEYEFNNDDFTDDEAKH